MALQVYAKALMLLDGTPLMEMQNVTVDFKSNAQPVSTIPKGFCGMSPGAPTTEIKCDSAVPRAGVEFAYLKKLKNLTPVEVVLFEGTVETKVEMFITDIQKAYGVGQDAKCSVTMLGGPAEET